MDQLILTEYTKNQLQSLCVHYVTYSVILFLCGFIDAMANTFNRSPTMSRWIIGQDGAFSARDIHLATVSDCRRAKLWWTVENYRKRHQTNKYTAKRWTEINCTVPISLIISELLLLEGIFQCTAGRVTDTLLVGQPQHNKTSLWGVEGRKRRRK